MKALITILLMAIAAVSPTIMTCRATEVPDSILTERNIRLLVVGAPDSVIKLTDIAEQRGIKSIPQYKLDLLRALAYNELRMNSMKELYAMRVLESDSIDNNPNIKLNALTILAGAQYMNGKYPQVIQTAMSAIELARAIGNRSGEYNALGTMAQTCIAMGDRDNGFKYLDQVISAGQNSDSVRELANVSWSMGIKVVELYADNKYDEAVSESKRRLGIIERIEKIGTAPEGYADQQKAYTYARLAAILASAGQRQEAGKAYDAFRQTRFGNTVEGGIAICDYLLQSGRYSQALEVTRPYYSLFSQGDTINVDYVDLLRTDARSYKGLGKISEGYWYLERAGAVQDSLYKRENISKAQEMAAMFNVKEKELMLEKSRAEAQRQRIWMLAASGIAVMMLLILLILVYYYRHSLRRNRIAAAQINDLLHQREYMREKAVSQEPAEYDEPIDDGEKQFLQIENAIVNGKLFLQAASAKKEIAEKCGTTQAELVKLIQQHAKQSLAEYLNRLKIEYSISLMNEHPSWTIEAIAQEAGFGNRGTYYQNFNKFYGMTPLQYRKAHGK